MDASESALLQSSLSLVKQRFQAAVDPISPSRAWLIHVHIKGDGTPAIYSLIGDMIDSFNWGVDEPLQNLPPPLRWNLGVAAIGRRFPPFRREVRIKSSERLTPICVDAATLLTALPTDVASRLWQGVPVGTELKMGAGLSIWGMAVFELANASVVGSSLRAARQTPITEEQAKTIFAPEFKQPSDADWYEMLPDFAAASVQAIDILQSWLADESTEAKSVNKLNQLTNLAFDERERLELMASGRLPGMSEYLRDISPSVGLSRFAKLANEVRVIARQRGLFPFPELDALATARDTMLVRCRGMLSRDGLRPLDASEFDDALVKLDSFSDAFVTSPASDMKAEANGEPPKPVEPQGATLAGGDYAAVARAEAIGKPAKLRRGRRKGVPASDVKEDQRIADAWATGQYASLEELATAFGITKPDVVAALDRHRKR